MKKRGHEIHPQCLPVFSGYALQTNIVPLMASRILLCGDQRDRTTAIHCIIHDKITNEKNSISNVGLSS